MSDSKPVIAIIGGTGDLGTGLARRWAAAGYPIVIGSRAAEKAEAAAAAVEANPPVRGLENRAAAEAAEIIVLTVPWANHRSTLETIKDACQGKLFIDVTVPLVPPNVGTVQLPPEGSAAVSAQNFLGEGVTVVAAFQNVAADHLQSGHEMDCDVLVSGNKVAARETVIGLAEACGMRAWHAGPLANSAAAEALTSVIIQINRRYKIDGAGIRITGVPGSRG